MELRDLDYFRALAVIGHVGRAAQSLGMSQPALSKSLRRLEASLGVRLFERTPKGVVLTSVGAALARRAGSIRHAVDQAVREAADLASGASGQVRLGTGPTMAESLLPRACIRLVEAAPRASVTVVVGLNDVLLAALERGELDLLLATFPDRPLDGFTFEPIAEDELAVVARKAHPFARRRALTLDALAGQSWALPGSTVHSRATLERLFAQRGLPPPAVAFEANSTTLLLAMVAGSDLLGYQPRRFLRQPDGRCALVELPVAEARARRRLGFIHRENAYRAPAAERLTAILREEIARAPDAMPRGARGVPGWAGGTGRSPR